MSNQDTRQGSKKKKEYVDCSVFPWVDCNQRYGTCEAVASRSTEGTTPGEGSKPRKGEKCNECRRPVKEEDNGIMCDSCGKWLHAGCGKCSMNYYKILQEDKNNLWVCPKCSPVSYISSTLPGL